MPSWLAKLLGKQSSMLGPAYMIGYEGPIWISTAEPYKLYNSIPQLKTVIQKKALMFSNMNLILVKKNSSGILDIVEDAELMKLLLNPNPLQSQNSWLRQFKEQEQVYGNQFIYKLQPSRLMKYPDALWNVSPAHINVVATGNLFEQTKIEQIIKGYEYNFKNKKRTFLPSQILHSKIDDLDNPIIGVSPIVGLCKPLSNTEAAYEYRNVIMKKKGAIGMLSNQSKDAAGALPLSKEEKKRLSEEYVNNYGIGEQQAKIILTEAAMTWTPMTYPTKDMLLFEEVDANMLTIIDAFGLNVNIFSNKSATFENVRASIVQCYQDTIIPEADQFCQALTKFLNIAEGFELKASFEHISILKEHKLDQMKSIETIVSILRNAVESGLLDKAQGIKILQNELGLS